MLYILVALVSANIALLAVVIWLLIVRARQEKNQAALIRQLNTGIFTIK